MHNKDIKKTKHMHLLSVIALDLIMLGIVLLVFAFFHHAGESIVNQIQMSREEDLPPVSVTAPPFTTAAPVTTGQPPQSEEPLETTAEPETTPPETTVPDNRTPWQIKFADKFTEDVVSTKNSYSSPNISITIQTVKTRTPENKRVIYHIADIYVASIDCFKTYAARNDLWNYSTQQAIRMDEQSGAIIALSGDYYKIQKNSFIIRNGELYSDGNPTCDICVMYQDGTIATFAYQSYDKAEILASSPLQIWNFGPELLDADGKAKTTFNANKSITGHHPRSALGYYEPGHYCFLVAEGRISGKSAGMPLEMMAQVFEELGCVQAYNLDGGASSVMTFNDDNYNENPNERPISDMIIVVEPKEEEVP